MLSRTAGDLFWTGRYVERADFIARLTDATLRLAAFLRGRLAMAVMAIPCAK